MEYQIMMDDDSSKYISNQMDEIASDMERLFYHLFCPKDPARSLASKKWHPLTDIIELDDKMVIKLELAGVDKKDISIKVRNNCLVVSGHRREIIPPRMKSYHQMEINYGEFERVIHLKPGAEESTIKAKFGKGFLIITVDKTSRNSKKPVNINLS